MSGEVWFVDCAVCGVEHVDYLRCGGTDTFRQDRVAETIFHRAAASYFQMVSDKKRGFDFVTALAAELKAMYEHGQKAAP
jgi:hypothetical protein